MLSLRGKRQSSGGGESFMFPIGTLEMFVTILRASQTMGKANSGVVFFLVVLSIAGTTTGQPPKPSVFFAFGDSYADTGNQIHSSSSWHYPYGITWPGYPTGRFGNGHIQTDFLADKLGLPSPTPYVNIANQSIASGVNFAIGGAGVTYALGVLPLNGQVDIFELLLRTGAYSGSFLAGSVTLVSIAGNDYSFNYTSEELSIIVDEVTEGMTRALERMYNLGLRNILVSNIPPINCVPGASKLSNYTTCKASGLIELHNSLLRTSVERRLNFLPNANFVILDEFAAFNYVLNNIELYGIKEKLAPCCRPLNSSFTCGDKDLLGNPLFTVCADPTVHVYWDDEHPVESTWHHVVELFYNKPGFFIGDTTLEVWLFRNGLRSPAPASAPGLGFPQGGADSQLEAAYQALIIEPEFAESLGLLQTANYEEYLAEIPDQVVTVFIPNNDAYYSIPVSTIDLIYGQNQVYPVVRFHVVQGFYDSTLLSGSVHNLTTVSGLDLLVTARTNETLIGPRNAVVVRPDLYKIQGQVVIHGINELLIPPGLQ